MKFPVSVREWEMIAQRKLTADVYDFFTGAAGEEYGKQGNSEALDSFKLISRVLTGLTQSDISSDNFSALTGQKRLTAPVFIAPTAHHTLAHPEGELATARAAAGLNIPYILSSMSDFSVSDVASETHSVLWQQLYIQRDREKTLQKIRHAERAGATALVLTVDMPVMGNRLRDRRNCFLPHRDSSSPAGPVLLAEAVADAFEPALSWGDLRWVRENTPLPLVLKGIVHPADALSALECGVDALYLSNHGGRQLDHHISPFLTLPAVAEVIQHRVPVIIDGGITQGVDIFKALALGADAVAIGRPVLWALSAYGQQGVRELLSQLMDDLKRTMHICGCATLKDINRDYLWFNPHSVFSHSPGRVL